MNQKESIESLNVDAAYASKFINNTNRHVFLTGKAGTGKTTFLKHIIKHTYKNAVIVAPTGIAAINAGGVTIHSMFQLPFGTFVPSNVNVGQFSESQRVNTPQTLTKNLQMQVTKRRLLQELELLIIDEVSMLRADLLDAIDTILRSVRRKQFVPFGGVQILFIGDLLQLPPVIKDDEWSLIKQHYKSVYFFEAMALQQNKPLYIELSKIYRQSDDKFIDILNNLRNNQVTENDIEVLNSFYKPDFKPTSKENYIHLTTHNNKADTLNKESLKDLKGKSYFFKAEIDGEFSEFSFPIEQLLELKIGAQVMFVKNDNTGQQRFFNGKIAVVDSIEDDDIYVKFDDNSPVLKLEQYTWENIKYTHNEVTNEIEEKVIGKFIQFPVKLAWAITVHKSQGLTFSKAIIDIGNAFAPGQVYVALSRLTSLDGLVLSSKINTSSLSNDKTIAEYSTTKSDTSKLSDLFDEESNKFFREYLLQCFNFTDLGNKLQQHIQSYSMAENKSSKQKYSAWAFDLKKEFDETKLFADKFILQLNNIIGFKQEGYKQQLFERIQKAKQYFAPIFKKFSSKILGQIEVVKSDKKVKAYLQELVELDSLFYKQQSQISKAEVLLNASINNTEFVKENSSLAVENKLRKDEAAKAFTEVKKLPKEKGSIPKTYTENVVSKKNKKEKHDTKKESYDQYKSGKTLEQIATDRNMVVGTIEGHLAHYVGLGMLNINDFVSKEKCMNIITVAKEKNTINSGEIKAALGDEYSYPEIKMVLSYMENMKK